MPLGAVSVWAQVCTRRSPRRGGAPADPGSRLPAGRVRVAQLQSAGAPPPIRVRASRPAACGSHSCRARGRPRRSGFAPPGRPRAGRTAAERGGAPADPGSRLPAGRVRVAQLQSAGAPPPIRVRASRPAACGSHSCRARGRPRRSGFAPPGRPRAGRTAAERGGAPADPGSRLPAGHVRVAQLPSAGAPPPIRVRARGRGPPAAWARRRGPAKGAGIGCGRARPGRDGRRRGPAKGAGIRPAVFPAI